MIAAPSLQAGESGGQGMRSVDASLPPGRSESVHLSNVHVRLGEVDVLKDLSLEVRQSEFLTILGPSGSGKTTTLNVIAGFIAPDAGEVRFGDRAVTDVPVHRRDIGILFQDYALFPHLDVFRNVAYPLKERRVGKEEIARRVTDALRLVDLPGYEDRHISTLSGGQQQRVGLARAIVFDPRVLLLDEPLGALDKSLRERMQVELRNLQKAVGVTTISVTHDQTEALSMSDRVVIMRDGCIEQVGEPATLYWKPSSAFVATFLGEANLLAAQADGRGARIEELDLRLPDATAGLAIVRPETLSVVPLASASGDGAQGVVKDAQFHGHRDRVTVTSSVTGEDLIAFRPAERERVAVGDRVTIRCEAPELVSIIPVSHDEPAAPTPASV